MSIEIDNSNKKFLLIFPPLWTYMYPHLALPILSAQLKNNGFNTKILDLNIDFFNYILNEEYLNNCLKKAEQIYTDLLNKKDSFLYKNDSQENQVLNYKFNKLSKVFNEIEEYKKIPKIINNAVNVFKDKEQFYDIQKYLKAKYILKIAIFISSLPYLPYYIEHNDVNLNMKSSSLTLNGLKEIVFDKNKNLFLDFYKTQIENIIEQEYSYIGISICAQSQLIGGLTISNILKNKTNAHINIGGSFFSRLNQDLEKNPEFFDTFADSVSYNEGESSIIELAKYINNEIPIEQVSNFIYKKDNKVIINPECKHTILSKIYKPDYSDYDFSKYFSPEPILPIETSRGCYWNKCIFCDHSYGQVYNVKKIDDLINEIKEYKAKYNISYFDIIDNSIHPHFLEEFCDALIKNNLDIKFKILLRFEPEINDKLLKKAYKAGLRIISWGFESGNERIYNMINKGVNYKNRNKIIKQTNKAGIANILFAMYGFPSETFNEAKETANFFKKNHKYVQSYTVSPFALLQNSIIIKKPEKFGIKIVGKQDFNFGVNYKDINVNFYDIKIKIANYYKNILNKYYSKKIFINFDGSEKTHLLLYLSKFSLKKLNEIKLK